MDDEQVVSSSLFSSEDSEDEDEDIDDEQGVSSSLSSSEDENEIVWVYDSDAVFCTNETMALMKAAENGHCKCVELLIQAGANVNDCDYCGKTPLRCAAGNGCEACVKLLIDAGADVNFVTHMFRGDYMIPFSALGAAAIEGNINCVEVLL